MLNILKTYLKRLFWTPEYEARKKGVQIGKNCKIATRNFGSEPYLIKIGNHVQITAGVKFFTHGGGWVFRKKHPTMDLFGKIEIGNNVYIGNGVMIMPGVTIGNDVIIGAGAIVTKSFGDGVIIAGNPAKEIGKTIALEAKILPYNVASKGMTPDEKKQLLLNLPEDKFLKK